MAKDKLSSVANEHYFKVDHLQNDIKKRAVRGAGATIGAQVAAFMLHLLSTVILARLLTPRDFGLVTMVTTFSLLLQNFGMNGFTEAIIQKEEVDHNTVSTLFWINASISLILTVIFAAFSQLVARFYHDPDLTSVAIAISFSILASGLSTIHLAVLKRNMKFSVLSAITMSGMAISVTIAIILAWWGLGYWALVANTVALPLTSAVGAWLVCRWRPGPPVSGTNIMPIIKFAVNTYGNFTMNYLSRNLDNLLVGKYFGSQSLGFYKKAYDIFALPVNNLSAPLTNVALSALSRISNDHENYKKNYLNIISVIAFMGMGLSLFFTLCSYELILLILGAQWGQAAEIFVIFGPSIGIMLVYNTHGWLHLSLGQAGRWFRWGIYEFMVMASSFIVGVFFGPKGVALAWTVTAFVLTVPGIWYAGKPVGLRVIDIINAIWKYLMAALISGILCWLLLFFIGRTAGLYNQLGTISRIIIASILCSSLYFLMVTALYQGIRSFIQVASLIKELLPKLLQKKPKILPDDNPEK